MRRHGADSPWSCMADATSRGTHRKKTPSSSVQSDDRTGTAQNLPGNNHPWVRNFPMMGVGGGGSGKTTTTIATASHGGGVVRWNRVRFHLWNAIREDNPRKMNLLLSQLAAMPAAARGDPDVLVALQTNMWREHNATDRHGRPRGGLLVVAASNNAVRCVRFLLYTPLFPPSRHPNGEIDNAAVRTLELLDPSEQDTKKIMTMLREAQRELCAQVK